MNDKRDDVRERVEMLGEEILSILLDLAERERGFEGGGADQTLREALAAISSFRQSKAMDDATLAELSRARVLLDKAFGMIGDEAGRESVMEAADFLDKTRQRAIEVMVERDRSGAAGERTVAPPEEELLLSLGTPALIRGLTIAVPRLFAQGGDTRLVREAENTDDDDEDEVPAFEEAPTAPRPRSRKGDDGERRMIESLARDTMEDLASFSALRVLSDTEAWKEGEPFEHRLLACMDSLIALARPVRTGAAELDLAEALFAYATEWIVPDRGRAFAFALTLCCVDSDAALLWVTMGLRRAAYQALPAYVDALSLGSNPATSSKLLDLLSEDVPRELMIVALRAALRRRLFNAGRVIALSAHPDAEVAALATRCFAFAPVAMSQAGLPKLALSSSPLVRAAAGITMNEIGMGQGREVLRELIDQTVGRGNTPASGHDRDAVLMALRSLAIQPDPRDADRVWATARALRSYREVGFFGHVAHVPLLFSTLDELDSANPGGTAPPVEGWLDEMDSVASALFRITGIRPPTFGPGRWDLPGFKQLWSKHGPDVQTIASLEGRIRFGKPWTKRGVVDELAHPDTRQSDRRILADELAQASNGELHFDVDGWIASQRAFLKMVVEAWDS